jgi:hypothetical protein
MDKSFDDLFNEFFNKRKADSNDRMKEERERLIEIERLERDRNSCV